MYIGTYNVYVCAHVLSYYVQTIYSLFYRALLQKRPVHMCFHIVYKQYDLHIMYMYLQMCFHIVYKQYDYIQYKHIRTFRHTCAFMYKYNTYTDMDMYTHNIYVYAHVLSYCVQTI